MSIRPPIDPYFFWGELVIYVLVMLFISGVGWGSFQLWGWPPAAFMVIFGAIVTAGYVRALIRGEVGR